MNFGRSLGAKPFSSRGAGDSGCPLGREGGDAKTCPTKVGNFQAMQREFFSEEMRNEDSRYIDIYIYIYDM